MSTGFKTATVASADVPATQTNFPVYIDLSRLGITTQAEADSVRVYANSSKTTEWARDIVSVSGCHCKIPSLTSTTSIYVYWDGTSADYAVTDTYGRNAVWSDYHFVVHMTTTTPFDSTGTFTITKGDFPTTTATNVPFGDAWMDFDGIDDKLTVTGSGATMDSLTAVSFSIWLQFDIQSGSRPFISNRSASGGFWDFGNNATNMFPSISDTRYIIWGGSVTNTNYLLRAVNSTSVTNNMNFLTNTTNQGISSGGTGQWSNPNDFQIASRPLGGFFDGRMQEARAIKARQSLDWDKTEYNNQSDEAGFWGTWSDVGGATNTTNFFLMM